MKKLLFSLSLSAAVAVQADDAYLYWMVGDDVATSYDAVKFAAVDGSGKVNYLNLATENFYDLGQSVSADMVADANDWGEGFLASLGSYASDAYTYFVELWNDNVAVGHAANGMTWGEAQNYLVSRSSMDPGAVSSWTIPEGGFAPGAIPEPTSGLMLLLGVAALALRRRRV